MRTYVIAGLLVSGVICFNASYAKAAPVDMREGQWEHTMETKIEGLPFEMPAMPFTVTRCVTKDDLVPRTEKNDGKCEILDQKISGNTVKWKVKCKDEAGMSEGQGEITYRGESYSGKMSMTTTEKKSKQVMTSNVSMKGRRIGDCPK